MLDSKVSVYIPTHNRSQMLIRAVSSVLNQSYKNIEVIVCDDGSQDDTQMIMQQWIKYDSRIRYIRSQSPQGANSARNKALEQAQGDFVTGLDDDDFFLPTRIDNFIRHYDDKYAFLYSQRRVVDKRRSRNSEHYIGELTLSSLLHKNVVGNQVFVKRSLLESINGFDEALPSWQDYDCWVRLMLKQDLALGLPDVDYIMDTSHEGQRITASAKALEGALQFYKKYQAKMSPSQCKTLESEILMMTKEKLTLLESLPLMNRHNFKKLIYRLANK